MNLEIYDVFKSPDIVTLIKVILRILEWLRHVAIVGGERTVKKLLEANGGGGGGRERRRHR
jgi:hypothetical protein